MHNTLILLVFFHFLADYPLQGEFLSKAKNHKSAIVGVPFYQPLFAHAFIHAGCVYLVTNSMAIAFAELFSHAFIDYLKCDGKLNFNQDQALHLICKVTWALFT